MKNIFLGVIAPSFTLIPIAVGFANYKFLSKELRLLCYFFIATLITNCITKILSLNNFPNLFLFHIYTVVEALFLFQLFLIIFPKNKIAQSIRFLRFVFPVYCIVIFVFFQNSSVLNTYTRPIEAIIFMILSLFYWWENSRTEKEVKWGNMPLNWIVSGFLFYFSSAFFLFLFSNVLMHSYGLNVNVFIWNIHAVFLMIMNVSCAIGFYKCRK